MSTLAYRDGVLACDMQVTGENQTGARTVLKVRRVDEMLFGGTGCPWQVFQYFEWISRGMPEDEIPIMAKIDPDDTYMSEFLWIDQNGVAWHSSNVHLPHFYPSNVEYWASGSGSSFALGAMAAGSDAITAIQMAAKHDIYTGARIAAISLHQASDDPEYFPIAG
ncbi:hypothetical protein [Candidatus Macondimonas diazotrophica]|jgi:ATP-dependent protease HslVU (ClpYQ) peptidase subunit|uniref:Uncharacterized protein n=1 Tax=Candidatus Macondimonas diazotrophica TaxID=2305248 RepID=A0A4Z0F7V4_9GAMM|nr:hypothetical protein [Candidatus Macondimonas diazotrophica]TFZ81621.1 hypothetical protein E4680_11605 [Candidatus Macondimonas diazotrophica]